MSNTDKNNRGNDIVSDNGVADSNTLYTSNIPDNPVNRLMLEHHDPSDSHPKDHTTDDSELWGFEN